MSDDDPFVYDEHGVPSGVKALPRPIELSETELHDVVVVATTANEFEALTLIETLDEAGIPAMKRSGLIHFGSQGPCNIAVPRKLQGTAAEIIEKFRSENPARPAAALLRREDPALLRGRVIAGALMSLVGGAMILAATVLDADGAGNMRIVFFIGSNFLVAGLFTGLVAYYELGAAKKK